MHIRLTHFTGFIGSALIAFTTGVSAADTPAKPPMKPLTDKQTVMLMLAATPFADTRLPVQNKELLNNLNVVQYRLSQTMSRIEGKKVPLAPIPGNIEEAGDILKLLDYGIASLAQTPDNPLEQSRHQNDMEARAQLIYWNAYGARQTERHLIQLIDKTSSLLASTIPDKKGTASPVTQMQVSAQKRSELLKILSELNQLLNENKKAINDLSRVVKHDKGRFLAMPLTAQTLSVPSLAISGYALEETTLAKFLPTEKTAGTAKKPATQKTTENYKTVITASKGKIDLITPGISHKWSVNNRFNANNWLSTGKYLAFDVYNQLDKQQRVKALKDATQDKNDKPMLGAAVITRLHIAYSLYLDRLEKFQLSACLHYLNQRLGKLENIQPADNVEAFISKLRSDIANIRINRRHYSHYADLRYAFSLLKTSFAGNVEKMQTFNNRNCLQTQAIQPTVVKPVIVKEKPAEVVIPAPKPPVAAVVPVKKPVKKKTAVNWISKEKASSYTLQIVSSQDKSRLSRYIKRHKLGAKAHITRMKNNGGYSYALHYGVYKDKETGFIAQFKLPMDVQSENQIWIRRIGDIQKNLPE